MGKADELHQAVRDAVLGIRAETGRAASEYFEGSDPIEPPASVASHGVGVIEGAAIALGLTPLELLDELGLGPED